MNADGSGQERLTTDAAWDGEPAWSPDGSQIAFSSYRGSVYRIWRMDADGSDQVRLSDQPYSANATWSSAGAIAFDADGNGDGWQELWTMNADGTGEAQRYDPPEADTDAWVGSWSADGRYVAFTRISWIYYGGSWYWTTAYLDAWDSQTGSTVRLSNQGEDFFPEWQTTDVAPPVSSVSALPLQSPSPITVSWSGSDGGPAGLASYDIQARDGAGGAWTDWLLATTVTSSTYSGVGGHTYYFRCRARDWAGNVEIWPANPDASTTVEALAPVTTVEALASYSKGTITVAWGGADPGGSGIESYDVQLRDGAGGAWTDWHLGTGATQADFEGETGHTYSFRSRGADRAGNVEAWPPGEGDTATTFYTWAISGSLRDNRGTPVMGVEVSLAPEPLVVLPSDSEGRYAAYEAAASGSYIATWEKAGYGALPSTVFGGVRDARADMTLPPADNAVQNGGFETGSLEPDWAVQGDEVEVLGGVARHSGAYGVRLGLERPLVSEPLQLSSTDDAGLPQVAVDGSGGVHVVWQDYTGWPLIPEIQYRLRAPDGTWLAVEDVSDDFDVPSLNPQLAVEAGGTAHVVWCGYDAVYYRGRAPDGTWSTSEIIGPRAADMDSLPHLVAGTDGSAHLVWESAGDILYATRPSGGAWTSPLNLSQNAGESRMPRLALDPTGNAYAAWHDNSSGTYDVYCARRSTDGTWSGPENLSNTSGVSAFPQVQADSSGVVHVLWGEGDGTLTTIRHSMRSLDGAWSGPQTIAECPVACGAPQLAVEAGGAAHAAWAVNAGMWTGIAYVPERSGGSLVDTGVGVGRDPLRLGAGHGRDERGRCSPAVGQLLGPNRRAPSFHARGGWHLDRARQPARRAALLRRGPVAGGRCRGRSAHGLARRLGQHGRCVVRRIRAG